MWKWMGNYYPLYVYNAKKHERLLFYIEYSNIHDIEDAVQFVSQDLCTVLFYVITSNRTFECIINETLWTRALIHFKVAV